MTSNQPITKQSTLDAFIQSKDFVTKMKQQAGVLYWYQLQKTLNDLNIIPENSNQIHRNLKLYII